jgi:hypothetical protein
MKITVITGPGGEVLGTARHEVVVGKDQPVVRLMAGPGQKAHEIELPTELENVQSAEALHAALQERLKSGRQQN